MYRVSLTRYCSLVIVTCTPRVKEKCRFRSRSSSPRALRKGTQSIRFDLFLMAGGMGTVYVLEQSVSVWGAAACLYRL